MGHRHNLTVRNYQPIMLDNIRQKVKTAGHIAATRKGISDVGKTIHTSIRVVAPIVARLL
jgi:hypothetical protein